MESDLIKAASSSIVDGDKDEASSIAKMMFEKGFPPLRIIEYFVEGMNYVGNQFASGMMFIPHLVMAGEAMKSVLAVLDPEMKKAGIERSIPGRVVIGTVEGDIHEIGKSLVATMLSANGFEVYDLGVNVSSQKFIEKANEVDANVIGMSALLTTTMVKQKETIELLKQNSLRDKLKIIVGGAPVNQSWANEIGADGYSRDAMGAVILTKKLLEN